ncbi:MAG: FkbM family methyltransferase [Rhodospirillales bacterium]|nr:FkbM family methyltransferase [Rhodospirillales bacterium]
MSQQAAKPEIVQPPPFPAFEKALSLLQAGQLAEALTGFEAALAENPDHIPSLVNIAVVLRRLGRLEASLRYLYRALERDPKQPGMWQNLGETLRRLKRFDEAVASFKKASQDQAILLAALGGMAAALKEAGQFDEAFKALDSLLAGEPGNAALWNGLAEALFDAGKEEAALAALRRAIQLKPNLAAYHLRMAYQLSQRGLYAEAEKLYRSMLVQGAESMAPAHVGLAQALISQGRLDEAEAPLARALDIDPNFIDIHLAKARQYFLSGRLTEAWSEYGWRKRHIDFTPPHLPVPVWEGQPLQGRSILLLGEQGAGDTIQFLRYAPLLAQQGAQVVVATSGALEELVRAAPGVAQVLSDGKQLPKTDYYAHLLDLPALLKTELATIPARIPYLPCPAVRDELKIAAPAGVRFKVGLAFAGNPRHRGDRLRSISFQDLAPLFCIEGAAFYSLQVGQPLPAEAKPYLDCGLLTDLAPRLQSFADTAAVMSQLDLVISVDTALVHLAGAIGKTAWVLLPFAPDWRWLLKRSDTPWYPNLVLFRQPAANDWQGAIGNAAKALGGRLDESRPVILPSAFKREDGQPRFVMAWPKGLLKDPGAAFIWKRESRFGGYEYATRAFLDAHLQPGDLLLDIGAHWGVIALSAASRWPGQVSVLAVEPDAVNAARLGAFAAGNGLSHVIETVVAGCADKPGRGRVRPGGSSSMGFSVTPEQNGPLALVSIDSLLAERPALQAKRSFVKIDVEGLEPVVVAGMENLMASGRVGAIILERGREYDQGPARAAFESLLKKLTKKGFRLMRFASEQLGGPLIPFVNTEDLCNFIALAPDILPLPAYPRPDVQEVTSPTQPERARLAGEAKVRRTEALMRAKASDGGFWADPANLASLVDERAKAAAGLLPGQGRVLDLGAGLMRVRTHLAKGVDYQPADLVPWSAETLAVDLNQDQFPQGRFAAILLLEVLEFLHEPEKILAACRASGDSLVMTYRLRADEPLQERRAQGWFNDFDEKELTALLDRTGWRIDLSVPSPEARTRLILARPKADETRPAKRSAKTAKTKKA